MKDIFIKYGNKLEKDINSLYFLYGGKKEDWKGEDDEDDEEEGGAYHKTVNCSNQ